MSTATRTPAEMVTEADSILAAVREAEWPPSREAQWAIGWAFADAGQARKVYADVLNGDLHPYDLPAEDRGSWNTDDLLPQALEWAADEYLEAAKAAQKRLAEYVSREAPALAGERGTR